MVSKIRLVCYDNYVLEKMMQLSDIVTLNLEVFQRDSGKLASLQHGQDIPWQIARVFFISTERPENRGNHAHINCQQAFVCTMGSVILTCKDGLRQKEFVLKKLNQAVIIPPGIWASISLSAHSSLSVMTNLPYDESDYIREWEDFQKFRGVI
jgi:UDP-2-acetamido-3-amino-2,3-dideoxy-glucuronate N-acetyltransferase